MNEEKKPDLSALQDSIMELAKDLLMLDGLPELLSGLSAGLDGTKSMDPEAVPPIRFPSRAKTEAFLHLAVAVKAAKAAAEDFRRAHLDEEKDGLRKAMEGQFADRMAELDREEMERRRAS